MSLLRSTALVLILAATIVASAPHPAQSGWLSSILKPLVKGSAKNTDELVISGKKALSQNDHAGAYEAFERAAEEGSDVAIKMITELCSDEDDIKFESYFDKNAYCERQMKEHPIWFDETD